MAPRGGIQLRAQPRHGPPRRLRTVLRAVELQPQPARPDRVQPRPRSLNQSDAATARADHVARKPVPEWTAAANRQLAWAADRHRRHGQLRRPEQGRPEGASVLGRRAARAGRQHGRHRRLRRRDRTRSRLRRRQPDRASTSIRSIPRWRAAAFPGPNGTWNAAALRANVPNPFFGIAGTGEFGSRGDDPGRPAAAAVPAVRRRLRSSSAPTAASGSITPRPSCSTSAPPAGGAAASATRWSQHEGQPVRPGQHLSDTGRHFRRTTTISMPSTASATSIRRIASSSRRFSGSRTPARRHRGLFLDGWNASAVVELVSGAPLNAVMSAGASDGQPRAVRRPAAAQPGRRSEHLRQRHRPRGLRGQRGRPLLQQRRLRESRVGTFGNAPRTDRRRALPVPEEHRPRHREGHDAVRQPHRAGAVRDSEPDQHGEVPRHRFERDRPIRASAAITQQAGFMRIWQLSFRYTF